MLPPGEHNGKNNITLALEPLAKTCTCLLMIHQGAAPISDIAFQRITWATATCVIIIIIIIIIIIKDIYIAPFRHAPKALCKKKVKC